MLGPATSEMEWHYSARVGDGIILQCPKGEGKWKRIRERNHEIKTSYVQKAWTTKLLLDFSRNTEKGTLMTVK